MYLNILCIFWSFGDTIIMRYITKIISTFLEFYLKLKMKGCCKSYYLFKKYGGLKFYECFFVRFRDEVELK